VRLDSTHLGELWDIFDLCYNFVAPIFKSKATASTWSRLELLQKLIQVEESNEPMLPKIVQNVQAVLECTGWQVTTVHILAEMEERGSGSRDFRGKPMDLGLVNIPSALAITYQNVSREPASEDADRTARRYTSSHFPRNVS
jgi:hypothetical protein